LTPTQKSEINNTAGDHPFDSNTKVERLSEIQRIFEMAERHLHVQFCSVMASYVKIIGDRINSGQFYLRLKYFMGFMGF